MVTCLALRPLFEHGDGRQGLAFEEFQEGAAAGRDVADFVGNMELGDSRQRVAAGLTTADAAR